MSHLKINSFVGSNLFRHHQPAHCYLFSSRVVSVGSEGELIVWNHASDKLSPLFILIPTINHEAGDLVSFGVVNTLTSILDSYPKYKILTSHQDNRVRVWNWEDGICCNITPIGLFDTTIKGICSDVSQTRIVFVYSQTYIYGLDLWKMSVVCRIKPGGNLLRAVKEDKTIVFQDSIRRIQYVDLSDITKEKWSQSVRLLTPNETISDQMRNAFRKFQISDKVKESEEVTMPVGPIQDSPETLVLVNQSISDLCPNNQIEQMLSAQFKREFPELTQQLSSQTITQSCVLFINNQFPYFFLGCESGRLTGIPLTMDSLKPNIIIFESTTLSKEVRFLEVEGNTLVCSLSNQKMLVYNLFDMEKAINNDSGGLKSMGRLVRLDLDKFVHCEHFLSASIKYKLQTFSCVKDQILAELSLASFQLENKQIVVFNRKDKSIVSLRGFTPQNKLLAVMLIDPYIGVVQNNGISIFRHSEAFERVITHEEWQWRNYSLQSSPNFKPDYHNYHSTKRQNPSTFLIDYSQRYLPFMLDYLEPTQQLLYEIFGNYNDQKIPNQQFPNFYFKNRASTLSVEYSSKSGGGMAVLKMLRNKERRRNWSNTSYVLHTDVRKQLDIVMARPGPVSQQVLSLPFIFPWGLDEELSSQVKDIVGGDVPTLSTLYCFQGIGTSFTVYPQSRMGISSFLTSYQAISIMNYFITLCTKEGMGDISSVMFKCVYYFTKKKPQDYMPLSNECLSQLTVSNSGNIVNTGCNLLISSIVGRQIDISQLQEYFVLNLKNLEENKSKQLSCFQVSLMLSMGFTYLYSANVTPNERTENLTNRLISAVDLVNFEKVPDLIAINMKILNEGMEKWKGIISTTKICTLLHNLFVIYFLYDGLSSVPRDDRKFNFVLDTGNQVQIKRMKQVIVKTIVYVSQHFSNEFLHVLKKEAVNQEVHHMYPCSVIEILRQFVKSQKPTKHLGFYVELLLKCLSPTAPQLRKYIQKNVTQTLHLMCTYKNISFNQPSQKLALVTDNYVTIYDLRTATKWKTIDLDKNLAQDYLVEMSPKGSYIAVLGRHLKIWRLSNSLWSGVLGAFSQGWTFQDVMGNTIKWDQGEGSVTVQASNPANTRVYTL